MRIAIDLSPLQGPHRMRGIGYTLINLLDNISPDAKKEHYFVFFLSGGSDSVDEALDILKLDGLQYEVRQLGPKNRSKRQLRGKLQMLVSAYNNLLELRDFYLGDPRFNELGDVDVFLQPDQSQGLPKGRIRKAMILYDVIPYALEWDYMWSYRTARIRGFPPKAALRCHVRRKLYAYKLLIKSRRADLLLSISECTKQDFVDKIGASPKKIVVTPLGINIPSEASLIASQLRRYTASSWGYSARPYELDSSTPYILFVGGADQRRKLSDLVTAFNHLRAEGNNLKLVLAGDSMQGPRNISTIEAQRSLSSSSYLDDIVFMGFVDDEQRDWLYKNALAFVFPSKYEGFGLPVLEAMIHRCPVIAYKNSATFEVAGDLPIYAENYKDIMKAVQKLMSSSQKDINAIRDAGYKHAKNYEWRETTKKVLETLS